MQKKAKLDYKGKSFIIDITDDLDYRYRIINELSGMAIERNPMLQPKKELINVPFIEWDSKDLYDDEEEKIQEIILKHEDEFNTLFEPLVIKGLNIKLKGKEGIWFGDSYSISDEDKIKGITIHMEIVEYN